MRNVVVTVIGLGTLLVVEHELTTHAQDGRSVCFPVLGHACRPLHAEHPSAPSSPSKARIETMTSSGTGAGIVREIGLAVEHDTALPMRPIKP